MTIWSLSHLGGIFAILVFWHFLADWVFQSHREAMRKAKHWPTRIWHCIKYTLMFWPLFLLTEFHGWQAGVATFILCFSHFFIDSYVPVVLWAKHCRQAPQFKDVGKVRPRTGWKDNVVDKVRYETDEEAFKAFASTPLGLVLMITMDQFFHIAFLLPVAALMMLQ